MANPLPGVISDSVWNLTMADSTVSTYYNKFGWAKNSMFKDYASGSSVASDLLSTIGDFLIIGENQFDVIKTIWGLVLPAACCLFVLYFLLNFTEEVSGRVRDLDVRYWTMTFIKFAMATVFLQYGILLVVGIIDVGNSWINSAITGGSFSIATSASALGNATSDADKAEYLKALIRTIHGMSGVEAMIKCVLASIVNLITAIPAIIIIIQAISREISIILEGGLTPLAFADIYEHGTRSTAFTYLKKFAVALVHGLLMVWIIQICSSLSMSYDYVAGDSGLELDLSNWISVAKPILYMFAEVGLIGASKSILNDVLGC